MAADLEHVAVDDLDRFISIEEAAERFGIALVTAYRMVRSNRFPVPVKTLNRIHKVSLRHVVEFINAGYEVTEAAAS